MAYSYTDFHHVDKVPLQAHRSRDIGELKLRGQFPHLKDVYATNLANNSKDFERLLNDLPHRLKQLPHIGTPIPKSWATVREILQQDKRNSMDLKEFLDLCEQHGFKHKQDKLQLSETLHDLGNILHFQNDELLFRTLFLKPHWVTQAVYRVLDSDIVKQQNGQFTKNDLEKIWHQPQYDFMHNELLHLMRNFQLCYSLKHSENTYIAPQLLSEDEPKYSWNSDKNLTVLYQNYAFMPKGIVTQLIVALHEDIADQQQLVWRTGVIFERDDTRIEVIENYDKRSISIKVEGQHCRDLMTIVHYELQKIHNSYKKPLQYEVLVPCSCDEPEYFEWQELKEFADDNEQIQCRKRGCRKMLDAKDVLAGVFNVRESDARKSGEHHHNYYINSISARDIRDTENSEKVCKSLILGGAYLHK